jgi:pimeloyl-ACP methyl ester carboxylesterase
VPDLVETTQGAKATAVPGAVPNGRLLPTKMFFFGEKQFLKDDGSAAIYAVANSPAEFRPEREPLLLVHGVVGGTGIFQDIVDRYKNNPNYQLYVVTVDALGRKASVCGEEIAQEMRALARGTSGTGRDLTIVAHSLSGMVMRRAINELVAGDKRGIENYDHVRMVAVDSAWHGFSGPADGNIQAKVAAMIMPDGMEEMRARSNFYQGDPQATSTPERRGLFDVDLPANVKIDLVFAERTSLARGPEDGSFMVALPYDLVEHYCDGKAIDHDPRVQNYWDAVIDSTQFPAFDHDMKALAKSGQLTPESALSTFNRHYPRFRGNHISVLNDHRKGPNLIDDLEQRLSPAGQEKAFPKPTSD